VTSSNLIATVSIKSCASKRLLRATAVVNTEVVPWPGPNNGKNGLTMWKLMEGIIKFREKVLPKYAQRFRKLALNQTPDTLFIACSDSRVVPDLVTSTHPGDLFTMRNVGNLIPPATADGI
jgi:hypothetical protein